MGAWDDILEGKLRCLFTPFRGEFVFFDEGKRVPPVLKFGGKLLLSYVRKWLKFGFRGCSVSWSNVSSNA